MNKNAWKFSLQCFVVQAFMSAAALGAELKFVTEPYAPFVLEVPGNRAASGPLVEITLAVCERIHAACSVEVFPWRRAYKMVEKGEADGIFPLVLNPLREKMFYFSRGVIESSASFFVQESSRFKYTQPKDLDGVLVGVYGPSANSAAVEDVLRSGTTGAAVVDLSNVMVLRKLAAGRYGSENTGAAVVNLDVGLHLLKSEGIKGIKTAGILNTSVFRIGFSRAKVSESQFHEFDKALDALVQEGTVKAILQKYGMRLPK